MRPDVSTQGQAASDAFPQGVDVHMTVNGNRVDAVVDARMTLLDFVREELGLVGAKKGCDHGQCGSCTMLVEGRRINSCLQLLAAVDGCLVTTVEGLGRPDELHRLQKALLDHDAYQCGFCTPGQICSAVGMLAEVAAGWPSAVTAAHGAEPVLDEEEIRERMSGNLCRCGAYVNLVPAILEVGAEQTG